MKKQISLGALILFSSIQTLWALPLSDDDAMHSLCIGAFVGVAHAVYDWNTKMPRPTKGQKLEWDVLQKSAHDLTAREKTTTSSSTSSSWGIRSFFGSLFGGIGSASTVTATESAQREQLLTDAKDVPAAIEAAKQIGTELTTLETAIEKESKDWPEHAVDFFIPFVATTAVTRFVTLNDLPAAAVVIPGLIGAALLTSVKEQQRIQSGFANTPFTRTKYALVGFTGLAAASGFFFSLGDRFR